MDTFGTQHCPLVLFQRLFYMECMVMFFAWRFVQSFGVPFIRFYCMLLQSGDIYLITSGQSSVIVARG